MPLVRVSNGGSAISCLKANLYRYGTNSASHTFTDSYDKAYVVGVGHNYYGEAPTISISTTATVSSVLYDGFRRENASIRMAVWELSNINANTTVTISSPATNSLGMAVFA